MPIYAKEQANACSFEIYYNIFGNAGRYKLNLTPPEILGLKKNGAGTNST